MPQTRGPEARYGFNLLREMNSELDQRRDVAYAALQAYRRFFYDHTAKEHGFYGLEAYDDAETGNMGNLSGPALAFADSRAVARLHQLHRVLRQSGGFQAMMQAFGNRLR